MSRETARGLVRAPRSADPAKVREIARGAWKRAALAYLEAFSGKAEPHVLFDLGARVSLLRSAVIVLS